LPTARTAYRSALVDAALAAGAIGVPPAAPAETPGRCGGHGGPWGSGRRWYGWCPDWQGGSRAAPAASWPGHGAGRPDHEPHVALTGTAATGR
jgi:hypothetical protein